MLLKKKKIIIISIVLMTLFTLIVYWTFANINWGKLCLDQIRKRQNDDAIGDIWQPKYEMNDKQITENMRNIGPEVFNSAEELTNVAINYWIQWGKYNKTGEDWKGLGLKVCNTNIPGLSELSFENIFWQTIRIEGKNDYHFYNAYYDNRGTVKIVRIIASQMSKPKTKLWCLLYFKDKSQAIISKINKFVQRNQEAPYETVLLSCEIPRKLGNQVPRAVSLINSNVCPKKVNNLLRVIYERRETGKEEFAVCHKSLRFAEIDLSLRLIEWLELLRIFGVSKVYLYALSVHPNMQRVLNYYQKLGFVEWRFTTLPGNQINNKFLYRYYHDVMNGHYWPQERLELNDCFYRNLHKYKFIANFDLDEIIVPKDGGNWSQMMDRLQLKETKVNEIQSFIFQGAKVYSDLVTDSKQIAYSLTHLHRTQVRTKNPKCIHVSTKVKYLATHTAHGCLEGHKCRVSLVYPKDGYFLHHRIGFKFNKTENTINKNNIIFDSILTKYGNQLERGIKIAFNKIFES